MTWMPFLCLGAGFTLGLNKWIMLNVKWIDLVVNTSLVLLMFAIGANIGTSKLIMDNLLEVGFDCACIAIMAIIFSIIFTLMVEKKILCLDEIAEKLKLKSSTFTDLNSEIDSMDNQKHEIPRIMWLMPISIGAGVVWGNIFLKTNMNYLMDSVIYFSLATLYTGVGINLNMNRRIFKYVRILGWKIILISITTFLGSIVGGLVSSVILDLPVNIPVMSAAGMSYYSVTGAYMSQVYGAEIGTYGFMVNVMREFFVILGLPIIIKISRGSAISAGASGNMDTMLIPVTKFTGLELSLVTLITGTILTFAVPFILPILHTLFLLIGI